MTVAPALFRFEDSYAREVPGLSVPWAAAPAPDPELLVLNEELAVELGADPAELREPAGVALLAGQAPEGVTAVAQAYAGHQFGVYSPRLGDGRALLLGEVTDVKGRRRDLHLKGSGRTPFSRGADGKAAVGPMLREYVIGEAMHGLGIPTTRALAVVATGERVIRERALPGAVLTRVAASHLRVGTFQYAAASGDRDLLRALADYAIARHYPEAAGAPNRYLDLYRRVVRAQARLVARWMLVGFVHGVMNTDNTTISGETIDYGPCAFMDAFDPATVFSSIDQRGRYAYANQPRIALWNLTRLAECLLPLFSDDKDKAIEEAQSVLAEFPGKFTTAYQSGLRQKIGLFTARDGDEALVQDLLEAMAKNSADFTLTFRRLSAAAEDAARDQDVRAHFADPVAYDEWTARWRQRAGEEPQTPTERAAMMRAVNPAFIPRNHRIEAVIQAAVARDDYAPFEELIAVLAKPYEEQPAFADYANPPEPDQRVLRTFCGT